MECTLSVDTGYPVVIKDNIIQELKERISRPETFIITDSNVYNFYMTALSLCEGKKPLKNVYVFPAGEKQKNLNTLADICSSMLKAGCGRNTTIIALGGGVTGDLAGFVAAVYMRGVRYIQVPTTLLSMVDSSIGGKTGVDLAGYKNSVGAFCLPDEVLMGLNFLSTLKPADVRCGIGEIVKTAILDEELFDFVDKNIFKLIAMEPETILEAVRRTASFKASVTVKDFKEGSLRKCLNLGHTIGHALESMDGYKLGHGEYVLSGIFYEAKMGLELGITDKEFFIKIAELVHKAAGDVLLIKKPEELIRYCIGDKKNSGGCISVIIPVKRGEYKEVMLEPDKFLGLITIAKQV